MPPVETGHDIVQAGSTGQGDVQLDRIQHNERWGEPAPSAGDVEGLHRQLRFQAYRHYVMWWQAH